MYFQISLDNRAFSGKPTKREVAGISARIANYPTTTTIEKLSQAIARGYTYCNAVFRYCDVRKYRRRTQENFESQQIFSLDLDDGKYSQLDEILEMCEDIGIEPAIIYESFSSSEELRKWRLIYVTDRATYIGDEAKAIIRYLNAPFQGDTAVIDSARLLFATTPDKMRYVEPDMILPIGELRKHLPIVKSNELAKDADIIEEGDSVAQKAMLMVLTPKQLELVRQICREAEEDVKNPTESYYKGHYLAVFSSAVKMGKISFLFTNTIRDWLLRWIDEAGDTYKGWKYSPEKVIEQGIIFGRNHLLF